MANNMQDIYFFKNLTIIQRPEFMIKDSGETQLKRANTITLTHLLPVKYIT